jgi:hypothetical protein
VDDLADLPKRIRGIPILGGDGYHRGVCEADDQTVFGGCVFVLCLGDETFSSIVVGLALPTSDTHTSAQDVLTWHSLSLSLAPRGREGVVEIPFSWERGSWYIPASAVFCLVARVVCLALDNLDERLHGQHRHLEN